MISFKFFFIFFFQAEDGIRDAQESRGLGDVYKRQVRSFSCALLPTVNSSTKAFITPHCSGLVSWASSIRTWSIPPSNLNKTQGAIPSRCLLYTSDAADEEDSVDIGGRRIIKKKKKEKKKKKKEKKKKKK